MIDADRVVLSPLIVPTHYSLVLSPDFVALEFGCDEEITLTVAEASITDITLHSKEINVLDVVFKSADVTAVNPSIVSISYNLKLKTATFSFDGPLPVGEAKLSIQFKGILNG